MNTIRAMLSVGFLFLAGCCVVMADEAQTEIGLRVVAKNVSGVPTNEFAVNEPVWLEVVLCNNGKGKHIVGWDEEIGLRLPGGSGNRCGIVEKMESGDRALVENELSAGETVGKVVVLSDYVERIKDGQSELIVSVCCSERKRGRFKLNARVGIEFKSRVTSDIGKQIFEQLKAMLLSRDHNARVRAIKSSAVLEDPFVWELLKLGAENRADGIVQYAAVQVAARMNDFEGRRTEFLNKALLSTDATVRESAQGWLDTLKSQSR